MEIRKGICIIASTNAINMNRQIRFILFLFIVSLTACQKQSHILPLLQEAETLMDSRPDSSLCLLESVQSPENLSVAEYATWCLLVTQARDKNYVEHTSDSVIGVAVRYFEKYGPQDKYGKSLYYKGRVCQELGKREDALTFYLKARDEIEELKDYNLLFLICSHLGTLYGYQDMKKEALDAYQDSYKYAVLDKDSSSISYSLAYIGRSFSLYQNWDSSIDCYKKAVKMAMTIHDTLSLRLALKELTAIYIQTRQSDAALSCLVKIENLVEKGIFKDPTRLYLTIGDLYRLEDDYVQAELYLNKALKTVNLYTKRDAYLCFYYLNEAHGEYKKAIHYNNLYRECVDSIQQGEYQKNLQEITAKYENEKLLNINNELKWKLKQRFFIGILFCIGAIFLLIRLYNLLKRRNKEYLLLEERIFLYQFELDEKKRLLQENMDKTKNLNIQVGEYEEKLQQLLRERDAAIGSFKEKESTYAMLAEMASLNEKKRVQLLKEKEDAEKLVSEKEKAYDLLLSEKEALIRETERIKDVNSQYENDILDLKYQKEKVEAEKSTLLNKIEAILVKQKSREVLPNIIVRLKKRPCFLDDTDWEELRITLDSISDNYSKRLQDSHPELTSDDIKYCCLLKLDFSISEIATMMNVKSTTVSTRKVRIKGHLDKKALGETDLDTYIRDF